MIIDKVQYDSQNGGLYFSHLQSRVLLADHFVKTT